MKFGNKSPYWRGTKAALRNHFTPPENLRSLTQQTRADIWRTEEELLQNYWTLPVITENLTEEYWAGETGNRKLKRLPTQSFNVGDSVKAAHKILFTEDKLQDV